MLVKFDIRKKEFELTHEARKADVRRYYVHKSKRFLLVLRNGLDLGDVQGRVVDANIGWDHGEPGYVREVGRRHSKLTVYKLAQGDPEYSLSLLLIRAPTGKRGVETGEARPEYHDRASSC